MSETDLYERISDLALKIGELNRKVDFILTELRIEYREPDAAEFNEFQSLLKANRKIEAIKLYRERRNVSLDAAKKAIDEIETGLYKPQ